MLLYIHIPFCDSKCFYCAFNSYTDKIEFKNSYIKALEKQLIHDLSKYAQFNTIETVFIGGGTPSCVEPNEYKNIFKIIKPYISNNCEITSEANPNSASLEWLKGMKNLGVNRISFGVQSFNDKKLKFLNRAHNKNSAITAIQNAKCIGFNSINCDIIYGVLGDNFEKIKIDMDILKDLNVDHISAYSLTLEEGTKFFNKSKVKIDDEELSVEIFDYLEELGFIQYEISNFSKSNSLKSKHNYGYWRYIDYLGVGTGAVGFMKDHRYYPNKDIHKYIEEPCNYKIENLSKDDIKVEKILLGLRCDYGFDLNLLDAKEKIRVNILIEEDKLIRNNDSIYNRNFLLADELAMFILN